MTEGMCDMFWTARSADQLQMRMIPLTCKIMPSFPIFGRAVTFVIGLSRMRSRTWWSTLYLMHRKSIANATDFK